MCDIVRDLGVVVNDSLTPSNDNHIEKITAIAHQRVNILPRVMLLSWLKNFVTYVRPLLEYNAGHLTLRVIFKGGARSFILLGYRGEVWDGFRRTSVYGSARVMVERVLPSLG